MTVKYLNCCFSWRSFGKIWENSCCDGV